MKKLSCLVGLLLSFSSYGQQDSSAHQRLQQQFEAAFLESGKKDPEQTYYTHLLNASRFLLRIEHPLFTAAFQETTVAYPGKDPKWKIQRLADSMIATTVNRALWQGLETELTKYGKLLDVYNTAICACLTEKLKAEKDYRNLLTINQDCEKQLLLDKSVINRMAVNMAAMPMSERLQLPKYASRYSYQNCPSLYAAMNDGITGLVLENYYQATFFMTSTLDETVVRLFNQQNKDSLALLFPAYLNAEKQLEKAAAAMKKAPSVLSKTKGDEAELATITKTLFSGNDKPQLLGQVIYSYSLKDLKVQMHSFRFLSADQIPNKKQLLKELNDSPIPPEVERLEDTRMN
jgi:hypothetical protein